VQYIEFKANAVVSWIDPSSLKQPEHDKFEEFVTKKKEIAPVGLKYIEQSAPLAWGWMPTEKAFVTSAMQGMTIAIVFAFAILLIATRNIVLAILSILCVTMTIVSVVCIMVLQDWQLGVAESICIVVLIGFSVDYVVHLAADFMHSSKAQRGDKMRQAYREMGISIFSGCLTTAGSGAFLFGGQLVLF